jgi:ParB family chromosome partitioning protein
MDIIKQIEKPKLPMYWDYETSTKFVSETIFKWRNLTEEVAKELWVARAILSKQGMRTDLTSEQKFRSWENYCIEIGSSKQTVNRWLKKWFETVHISNNSGEYEWYTPNEYVEYARNVMERIDLDPATSVKANETIKAEQIFTKEDDGLLQEWSGNVWLNPPYSQPLISEFSDKLINELPNIDQACVLVNNATETVWFQNMLSRCDAVCFLKGRIKYLDENGDASNSPLQGQTIIYFGKNHDDFINKFNELGICLIRKNQT